MQRDQCEGGAAQLHIFTPHWAKIHLRKDIGDVEGDVKSTLLTMGSVRRSSSRRYLCCAAMKLQLLAFLVLGLALEFSMPTGASVAPGGESAYNSRFSRSLLAKDQLKKFANYAKLSGTSGRSRSRGKGVGVPDFPYNLDYLTRFSLGTPPREFWGFLDTGSDAVWVQCDPCKECVTDPDAPLFKTNTSTSYKVLPCSDNACTYINQTGNTAITNCSAAGKCEFLFEYGTGEATGELSSDVLTLNSDMGQTGTFNNFVFGCTHQDGEGAFPIVALSRSNLSLVGQLGPKVGTAFSFCFSTYEENKTTEFTLGSRGVKDLMYTPLVNSDQTVYFVNLTGISVGKHRHLLPIPPGIFSLHQDGTGGVILDTGSTLTTLAADAYYPLRAAVESVITYPTGDGTELLGLDLCYNVTELNATSLDQLKELPSVTFHFQDLDLQLPPANIFETDGNGEMITIVCLFMMPDPSNSQNIFGNFQMQNHYFFFDPDNSRVGIKPNQC